nr:MAG TPA: hypothetical protein [Caudoviricetes sp.]
MTFFCGDYKLYFSSFSYSCSDSNHGFYLV